MPWSRSMRKTVRTSALSLNVLRSTAIAASFAAIAFVTPAKAQLAIDQTDGGYHAIGGTGTLGYQFNVLQAITVTDLFAYTGNAFPDSSTKVGIWNSTGDLIASATISITSPALTTPSANGGHYDGATIDPLNLSVGTYTIGETINNAGDTASAFGTLVENSKVSYDGIALSSNDSSLGEPTNVLTAGVILGPSFEIGADTATTPEPGSLALLAGMATIGLGIRRKRHARA